MSAGAGTDAIARAVDAVRPRLDGVTPEVAIVLGSGLGGLGDRVEAPRRIPYGEIPGFHVPTVQGHKGELIAGTLAGVNVVLQSGRFHMYEGHAAHVSALPVRVMAALGAKTLIVTNAAGGIRRAFAPGTLMAICDHINLTGRNPLEGEVLPGETRFPDMTVAYDADLRKLAHQVAVQHGIALGEGVYAALLGPTYETPAEIRMLERLGADAVGMSTAPEVIVARARGMRVLGISTITNPAAGIGMAPLHHAEVMDVANQVAVKLATLVEGVVAAL
ncbi:MAG TPA: purine-nucleoside phosphorylase [Gemmatimonadales bacterium]